MSLLRKKKPTVDPENVRYDWPKIEDIEVVENTHYFFGPVGPVIPVFSTGMLAYCKLS